MGKIKGILEKKNSILLNKLMEFSEKLKEFSEKLKDFIWKIQGFANSTWFLMLKNVQKVSLQLWQS